MRSPVIKVIKVGGDQICVLGEPIVTSSEGAARMNLDANPHASQCSKDNTGHVFTQDRKQWRGALFYLQRKIVLAAICQASHLRAQLNSQCWINLV